MLIEKRLDTEGAKQKKFVRKKASRIERMRIFRALERGFARKLENRAERMKIVGRQENIFARERGKRQKV